MNTRVEQMVELLFQKVEFSEEVRALHDEVMNNCQERFTDLVHRGLSEEEAAAAVMESLQGMEEVLAGYPQREETAEKAGKSDASPETDGKQKEQEGSWAFRPEEVQKLDIQVAGCQVEIGESTDGMVNANVLGDIRMEINDGTLCFRQDSATKAFFRDINLDGNIFQSFETFGESVRKLVQSVTDGIRSAVETQGKMTVYLPAEAHPVVSIRTTSGDVNWEKAIPGDGFSVQTTSGDIEIVLDPEEMVPKMEASTTSGDISCRMSAAEVRLETISGDIDWSGDAGVLSVQTTSGDAEMEGGVTLARLHAVSGDLTLRLEEQKAEVEISTVSGDAEIQVPERTEEVHARLDSVSGDLRLRGVQTADSAGISIRGKTVSGDMIISR
ncbi:MAG: DUF4097 family beta strand repeat protein [Clostridia bacterium]|nr:DUF4097 family beta strand repeat protein [Clostridia bacterium]